MYKQLLIVDDDCLLTSFLASLFSDTFQVFQAHSELDAVTSFHRYKPCVVLLDLGMPPNTYTPDVGLKLLSFFIQADANVKVIVLTGQQQEDVAMHALELGAFDFLQKPASAEVILAAVQRAVLFSKQQAKKQLEKRHDIQFTVTEDAGLKQVRNEAEKRLFYQVWLSSKENVHETARRLGIKRENVYYLLDKFGIARADS